MESILYETHSHTFLCKHAQGTVGDYAQKAYARGLKGLTITCHCPLPDGMSQHVRMDRSQYALYQDLVAEARDKWRGKVDVQVGLESDYFPGLEKYLEELHAEYPLNYILGSVHPQINYYRERFSSGTWQETVKNYFDQLAETAETGMYDCLAHPDLIKNENPENWNVASALDFVRPALDRIAKTGLAMELNTSGVKKSIPQMNPAPEILHEIRIRGIPMVIGADAHVPERVGDLFEVALDTLEKAGFKEVSFFKSRERQSVLISDARGSLI
ncbi:MAG: histidinol-phosphatase [Verrucomicrobiota bacterium]